MDIPVDFLLENLKNLVMYHVNLVGGAKRELEKLNKDLSTLRAILKDASKKYKKSDLFKEWERQVRETVYDVEDAIDTCITETAAVKAKNVIRRTVAKANNSISLAKLVKEVREDKVATLFDDYRLKFTPNLMLLSDTNDTSAAETIREIRQKKRQTKIVGFEDEASTLIGFLNEPSDKLDVVSIIGMPGLGKTTVAWKIFQDQEIKFQFPILIWVNISDDLNIRNVLLTIISTFTNKVPDDNTTLEYLGNMVTNHLKTGKYLIVMDDVWSTDAWDELKSYLPVRNAMGRVLITSREEKVAFRANVNKKSHCHKLRFLTENESWELLQHEVYDEVDVVPDDLKEVGQLISKNCDGLPLSIVVIGGILKDKISDAGGVVQSIKKEWDDVSTSISNYLVLDKTKRLENIIRISYTRLPYELRDCFLYLGVFPEDAFISVKKLTLLWIAEGFIQEVNGKSLEEIAQDNLKDLINRNLLMVEKAKPNGEAKVCRVHDTIRQFCKTEARFESLNLFQEVTWTNRGIFQPPVENVGKYRRLCIHSYVHKFLTKKPKLQNARTFLCFPKSPINLDAKDITSVTEAFDLLRVLDAGNIKFPKFPQKLLQLIHLRYLTLTFSNDQAKVIPEVISNLWNLQTLIVDIPARTLQIKADITVMRHLRHLKTRASIVLKNEARGEGGASLQTLDRLSPDSCTETIFNKTSNLIKLGIQGDLSPLLDSKCFEKLDRLNKLKLLHVVHNGEASGNPLRRLPDPSRFPPNLKILVLASTYLDWERMSVLGNLDFLEALKLKENAFTGNTWKAGGGGFKHLELLDIERANVMFWKASADSFPQLRFLSLKHCEELKEVPLVLGNKLEMLYLERVTQDAVCCGKDIEKTKGGDFVLKIAPADNSRNP